MTEYSSLYFIDLLLKNQEGQPVGLIEIKSYPKTSIEVKTKTFEQLENYANKLGNPPVLRYYTILSPATGYVMDIKNNTNIEFPTKNILEHYLPKNIPTPNQPLLASAFSTWLRDLSLGVRELSQTEQKLKKFGFIDNIKGTAPVTEVAIKC